MAEKITIIDLQLDDEEILEMIKSVVHLLL